MPFRRCWHSKSRDRLQPCSRSQDSGHVSLDRISKSHRSWNMSRIRPSDTLPEVAVRSALHRIGYRFRLHVSSLPGRPDIVMPRLRLVIFVHGCYWHRHRNCRLAYSPKSNRAFWQAKFRENVRRDAAKSRELTRLGWHVAVIWECATSQTKSLEIAIAAALSKAGVDHVRRSG